MKTLGKTLALDSRLTHLYRPLARNLILIIGITLVLAATTLILFDHRLVNSLSERLIVKSSETTGVRLRGLFKAANDSLRVATFQIGALQISDAEGRKALFTALAPFLETHEFLDSINLANAAGNEYVLIKKSGEILTRHVNAGAPQSALWQRHAGGAVVEEWTRRTDVSPLQRPWYQGALEREPGEHFWTEPYAFLTTKEPGISVSTRWSEEEGSTQYVLAFNITLSDVSSYTTRLRPSENGMIVVFDDEGRTIGLPPDPRFADTDSLLRSVLSPVSELGVPALGAALSAWGEHEQAEGIFPYRVDGRTPWWSGFSRIVLDRENAVWTAVMIPEADFLGSIAKLRNLSLAGVGLAGILVAGVVLVTSMRSIRRQMQAAIDQVERKLGQYQLMQKIGEGGNGAVYRAQHALLRRPTAIKLMNPEFARSDAARQRFEHEVQLTSKLSHPNTIAIYDYGRTPDGTLYYAMEFLNGCTLEHLVRIEGPLPPGRVIHLLEQIAGSLAEAHDKGLIHRDIKPSNVILCERGGLFDVVKVVDFGLVKELAHTDGELTHANVLIGTPLFMAPEIISHPGRASPQSDLYALGAVGYYLLTGRNVFDGESAVEICAKHLNDLPVAPSQRAGRQVPRDLEAVILACLEKDPANRPAGARGLLSALRACADLGSWTQDDAVGWWKSHSAVFEAGGLERSNTPLSRTELLVDVDGRVLSGSTTGSRASGSAG